MTALTVVLGAVWGAPNALAGWRSTGATTASIAYNQGVSFDPAHSSFFFDGVTSTTNSGLYRTTDRLVQSAANMAVIPPTREGYNHAGDPSFDSVGRRVLLPLECYYPGSGSGGNTCGVGAIGVADPVTLRFLYYVNLDTAQIKKAMWAEISPDGRWIWTSSGTHLLAYRASAVNSTTAEGQRAGSLGGLTGTDLGAVLPGSGVTGAAFYQDVFTRVPRLLLALNQGSYSELISYAVGAAPDGSPTLLGSAPRAEISVPRSSLDNESEGLAVTGPGLSINPLGGVLDWLMLPAITPSSIFSRILSFVPVPAPPADGATAPRRQRLTGVLRHGLRVTVVCNRVCTSTVKATINGRLARRLGLASSRARLRPYCIGSARLRPGNGRRALRIFFGSRARRALRKSSALKVALTVALSDAFSARRATYKLTVTLHR